MNKAPDASEADAARRLNAQKDAPVAPIAMLLWCPECGMRHIDRGRWETNPHHTHACQHCGHAWRPAVVTTVGVQFLPGFKDGES
jgi:predicted RNA-binding Zn-ribbon protein involved in translation (DUF1610 family)